MRLSVGRRRRADEGAAAEPPRHEARLLELIERAADGAARRLKRGGQFALGRQPVALAIGAGLDGALKISGDGARSTARLGEIDDDRRRCFAARSRFDLL